MKRALYIISVVILTSCNPGDALTDEVYSDTLKQNIGGKLIRKIHYWDTFTSATYEVNYYYQDASDQSYFITSGLHQRKEMPSNEQLIQAGKWLMFKTPSSLNSDKLVVIDKVANQKKTYEISPVVIEQTALWKKQKINSVTDNYDKISSITAMNVSGIINVNYVFRYKDRNIFFSRDKRVIQFKIDLETGKLLMTNISI